MLDYLLQNNVLNKLNPINRTYKKANTNQHPHKGFHCKRTAQTIQIRHPLRVNLGG